MRRTALAIAITIVSTTLPSWVGAAPAAQDRSIDPVVLTGAQFATWSAGGELTAREPQTPTNYGTADSQARLPKQLRSDCYQPGQNPHDPEDPGDHNCSQSPRVAIYGMPGRAGVAIDRLRGYRWTGAAFEEIPFQVDEKFTRYITNNVSDFAFYSGVDQHLTYTFDREGYRFTDNRPEAPCVPIPRRDPRYGDERIVAEPDPLPGLDDNDELVFMVRDAGRRAPAGATVPAGIEAATEITIADPSDPGAVRYAYVMVASPEAPPSSFTASNGYVRYDVDPHARDTFVFSESSYEDYGAAPQGPYCLADGTPTGRIGQRRPLDTAWVRTPRYQFRYGGRWLMTQMHVSADPAGDWLYGPDIIDRWKARAYQQDPSSETPCCGYEEEEANWGGSSILLGERSGPVRTIRETWGADSGTNVIRRETFYRDLVLFGSILRVHPITPIDGIYSQWDYNAGRVSTYYNPRQTDGVPIDGRNDEVFGNLDDPCNARYDERDDGLTETYRDAYEAAGLCGDDIDYHQSIDVPDPTHGLVLTAQQWEEVAGPHGTLVMRNTLRDVTPGGAAHAVVAASYYRDDACFDDGTGTDPGPRRRERRSDELVTYRAPGDESDLARRCWSPADGLPDEAFEAGAQPLNPSDPASPLIGDEFGDERYFQGDIGTHGLHLLLVAESDNLQLTVPTTEISSEQRMVVLPGDPGNVGDRYGHAPEFPLMIAVRQL